MCPCGPGGKAPSSSQHQDSTPRGTAPKPPGGLAHALTSTPAFALFALALGLYNALGVANLALWGRGDFWEHLAAIDAFARNPLAPANPYVAAAQSSHLFTPYHLVWGLVAALTRNSAYSLAPVMTAANSLLFAVGLRVLAKRLTGSSRWALPLGLSMLYLWYNPYQWSGFHNFGLLPVAAIYPFWCALPLAMIAIGTIDEARPASALSLVTRALAVALIFLVHPLGGSFLALVLVIRAFAEPSLAPSVRLAQAAAPIAGLALSLAWPYFPVFQAVFTAPRYASQNFGGDWRLFYDGFLLRVLPACLGLLFLIGSVRRRRADWLHWTLLACLALYLSNPFLARSALLSRYLIYVALALQWAVVRWLAEDEAGFLRPRARILLFFLVFEPSAMFETRASLAWIQTPWSPPPESAAADPGNRANVRRFRAYAPYLGTREVTMARMNESWVLPALLGSRVVGVKHGSPFMPDFDERQHAVERFFDPTTRAAERSALMARYAVTRVLVRRDEVAQLNGVSALRLLFADEVYEIREVR